MTTTPSTAIDPDIIESLEEGRLTLSSYHLKMLAGLPEEERLPYLRSIFTSAQPSISAQTIQTHETYATIETQNTASPSDASDAHAERTRRFCMQQGATIATSPEAASDFSEVVTIERPALHITPWHRAQFFLKRIAHLPSMTNNWKLAAFISLVGVLAGGGYYLYSNTQNKDSKPAPSSLWNSLQIALTKK